MIGITAFGGHIPRLRLKRQTIYQSTGWLIPATIAVAQGERSVGNWDEDSLSMAVEASIDCLQGMDRSQIDAVLLASTTLPYADRQNAGILKAALNLKDDLVTADFTASNKSATTALVTAFDMLKAGEKKNVLVSATDMRQTKGAYFYEMWYGDGAGSLLVGSENVIAEFKGAYSLSYDFVDHYRGAQNRFNYTWEERWVRDEGFSRIIPEVVKGLFEKTGLKADDFSKIIFPCFFTREQVGIAKALGFSKEKVQDNMHMTCGETGAAHPFVMLIAALQEAKPGDKLLMVSFGQGSDAIALEVTENMNQLPPRLGIKGSLENKKELDKYEKYLQFRKLVQNDFGIRAELDQQSALSTLWRKRKMILGLVGAKCKLCGTPQFPPTRVCVNPECNGIDEGEDYEFADRQAKIVMYTGDMLAVSQDPPAIYGLIQYEGGGRMMADFTDCELDELKVGLPLRMTFRKRWYDEDRGYHGYFWKATPVRSEEG